MLYVPSSSDLTWQFSNTQTTRPAAAFGTSVTPGTAGTKGSWATCISAASVVTEVFGILICINNFSTSATTRNILMDIGVDPAGGTSFSVVIPDLIGGHASPYNIGGGGVWYYFPLYIPSGASIGARATGTTATAGNVSITVFGRPKRPDSVRCGSKVFAFGATLASATGTAITLGTTADGAWTQVGGSTSMPLWWWQVGYTCVDTTMTAASIHMDVAAGDASNKIILLENMPFVVTAAEQISNVPFSTGCVSNVPTGRNIYVRGQTSTTADTAISTMVWGLGG